MDSPFSKKTDLIAFINYKNESAVRHGLPAVRSIGINPFGMQWHIDEYVYAPNLASVAREGLDPGSIREFPQSPLDLMPIIQFRKLSDRLLDFYVQVDRCTSKQLVILDTLPSFRKNMAKPGVHYVSRTGQPNCIYFYMDMMSLDETTFAHELAHVWLYLVDDAPRYCKTVGISDIGLLENINFVVSFVEDQRVNDILIHAGFDLDKSHNELKQAIMIYGNRVPNGFRCKSKRAEAFQALIIATVLLEWERNVSTIWRDDLELRGAMQALKIHVPATYCLGERLADAVRRHGVENFQKRTSAQKECLQHYFEFTDDVFDPDVHIQQMVDEFPSFDKWPDFMPGLPTPAKLELGRVMAKYGIGTHVSWRWNYSSAGRAQIQFLNSAGQWTPPETVSGIGHLPIPSREPDFPFLQNGNRAVLARHQQHKSIRSGAFAMEQSLAPTDPTPKLPLSYDQKNPVIRPAEPDNITPVCFPWDGGFSYQKTTIRPDIDSQNDLNLHYLPRLALSYAQETMGDEDIDSQIRLPLEHPYVYVKNNPLTYIDPLGLFSLCCIWPFRGYLGSCCTSTPPPSPPAPTGPILATIASTNGTVQMNCNGSGWTNVVVGQPFYKGCAVRTSKRSSVSIRFTDGSIINLGQLSSLEPDSPVPPPAGSSLCSGFHVVAGTGEPGIIG